MVFSLTYSGVGSAADLARGEVLFELCQQCHGPDGAGDEMSLAPSIAGHEQWYLEAQLNHFRSGARGLHPDDIAGLRMYPMAQWLRGELSGWAESLIFDHAAAWESFLRRDAVQRMWREHRDGRADHHMRIWMIVAWVLWSQSDMEAAQKKN